MVIVFMISRLRGPLALSATLIAVTLGAASCERVPLLAPTGSTISLISAATALPFNGSAEIIAQVIEASGTPPHSGTKVSFTTNLGSFQPADAETDIAGRATVKFLAGTTSGTASISAISGGVTSAPTTSGSVTTGNILKIAIGAAAVASVVMNASPSVVSASGGSSTITAKVADAGGNALAGIPVAFTTDAGSLNSSAATSDAAGTASVTLTTNRTAKVTGTAGVASTSGTTTTAAPSSTVQVTANATSTVTIGAGTPSPVLAGQNVSFPLTYTTTAGGSPVARVSVDWGDTRSQSYSGQPASIAHSFASAGSYLIVVTAIDTFGDSWSASAAVTVAPRPLVVVTIAAAASPTAGAPAVFTIGATATTGNFVQQVAVDFGDTSQLTLQGNATSVQHVYAAAGTYTVTAIATDTSGASGAATTVIVVGQQIPLVVTVATSQGLPSGGVTTVQFTATVTPAGTAVTSYVWTFGDGTNLTTSSNVVTHQYVSASGSKTATVTATAATGQTTSTQILVNP